MKNNFIQAAAITVFIIAGFTSLWLYNEYAQAKSFDETQEVVDSLCTVADSLDASCCDTIVVDTTYTNR